MKIKKWILFVLLVTSIFVSSPPLVQAQFGIGELLTAKIVTWAGEKLIDWVDSWGGEAVSKPVKKLVADATHNLTKPQQKKKDRKTIFVEPSTFEGLKEVDALGIKLGEEFLAKIKKKYKLVNDYGKADFIVGSSYRPGGKGMELYSYLRDKNSGKILHKSPISSYALPQDQKVEPPPHQNFERKLKLTMLPQTSDLVVQMTTNKGHDSILYKEGEIAQFMIRMNLPGYYFIVGYTDKPGEKFTYLLDLSHRTGHTQYVQQITGNQVGKWVNLGKFKVRPPLGMEALHIIAAKESLDHPPILRVENRLALISDDILSGLKKYRAFEAVKKPDAEDYIIVTTIKK